jgi:6 kDa early secretory antigenic target
MGEIKVTFGALEAARADVAGTATRISGRLDDLRRAVTPLAATWEGQAAAEYQARQRQWDTAAADLTRVLADIGRALGEAEAGYRATENANAALWRRA